MPADLAADLVPRLTDEDLGKAEATRQGILEAAARIFRRDGYASARLSDIAAEMGMKAGSLYYHFGSREALVEAVMEQGRKGVAIQRYKGLGEMNPEQLWQTTLDAQVRSLLQVKVSHADEAEEIFSTLMGDVVEPRREFIQTNALNVANLDI